MDKRLLQPALLALALLPGFAAAAVSADEAAKLGKSLTPLGAERAGNSAGTIPAWDPATLKVPASFVTGGHYPDPFAGDKPLFTIDGANYEKYEKNLTPGQVALLKRYPGWKMIVYPSRRAVSNPQGIYDETRANATQARLAANGNGVTGTTGGTPFPIPQNGLEAIWNHLIRYRGDTFATSWAQAAVTNNGDYTLVRFDYEYDNNFGNQKKKPSERADNLLFYFLQVIKAPPRLAGGALLVHEFADQVRQPRKAWSYSPGQRRVRLAPSVGYDNPGTAADGLRTNDDFGMYNGATDRYDWKLVGKRELYIPYNEYKLNGNTLKIRDILLKNHINPEHCRYELHRVWVVEATLKGGTSHVYKRRTFYLDEDSWSVHAVDKYDNRNQLWRVDETHSLTFYDVPYLELGIEVKHDLQSGRYIALRLANEEKKVYQPIKRTAADFSPDALRDKGTR